VIHSCFLILQEAVVGIQYTPQDLQGPAHTLGNPGGKMICAWSVFFYLGTRNKTTLLRVIPSMVHDMSRRKSTYILYILTFYLTYMLAIYLKYILAFYLTFCLTYILAFYLAFHLRYTHAGIMSDI
jgi:hypothetical protein